MNRRDRSASGRLASILAPAFVFWIAACAPDAETAQGTSGGETSALNDQAPTQSVAPAPEPTPSPAPAPAGGNVTPTPSSATSTTRPSSSVFSSDEGPAPDAVVAAAAPAPSPAPTAAPAPLPVTIPAGTTIPIVMEVALSTRTHVTGDLFYARVAEEVLAADGMVLIPEGTRVEGKVAEARRAQNASEEALLLLTFEALLLRGGRVSVDAVVTEVTIEEVDDGSNTRTAVGVATGAAAGAIVGRILGRNRNTTIGAAAVGALAGAGIALTTRDGHAEIREGARLVIELQTPTLLATSG